MLKGKVWKFGDNIDTDIIIPARYLAYTDPQVLGQHCMEPLAPDFANKVQKGDIIVAGTNFGCGSSREHAPLAIAALGVPVVIARSLRGSTGTPLTRASLCSRPISTTTSGKDRR